MMLRMNDNKKSDKNLVWCPCWWVVCLFGPCRFFSGLIQSIASVPNFHDYHKYFLMKSICQDIPATLAALVGGSYNSFSDGFDLLPSLLDGEPWPRFQFLSQRLIILSELKHICSLYYVLGIHSNYRLRKSVKDTESNDESGLDFKVLL